MILKSQYANGIQEHDTISAPFLIKYAAVQTGKTGKAYMNLVLMDRTGEVEARVWERVEDFASVAVKDAYILVEGRCQLFQGRKQVVIKSLSLVREDQINPTEFMKQSEINVTFLLSELDRWVESMEDPDYRELAQRTFAESDVRDRLRVAPAAKAIHHAYRGGLLEHMVSILGLMDHVAQHYAPHLNRDLLFIGVLFHDLCKLWELSYERTFDYTDEGRLVGHLVMGVELIDRMVREIRLERDFSQEKLLLAKHVVLAHHGKLEFGSPKEPQCLEALIVHMLDDLDSKVNSILKFAEEDQTPGRWTALHRQFNRYFWKPDSVMQTSSEHSQL